MSVKPPIARRSAGFGMIEVLISLLIIMIGLLGMAGLVGRSLTSQMEVHQRAQAIVLAKNMVARINANTANVASYVTAANDALGTGKAAADCTLLANRHDIDLCEWNNLLLGATEVDDTATNVGAMIGARGCVYQVTAGADYRVAVAWQGLSSTVAPPAAFACGSGNYGTDLQHRLILLPVTIANLAIPTPL